jgi:hypothetical protein
MIPLWLLPYRATVATITGYTTPVGKTESEATYAAAMFRADIQHVVQSPERVLSFGIEPSAFPTHVCTIETTAGCSQGDMIKFLDGPEKDNHFRIDDVDNVRGHHLELQLVFDKDATADDLIGGI